jgi:hypothetical protein
MKMNNQNKVDIKKRRRTLEAIMMEEERNE